MDFDLSFINQGDASRTITKRSALSAEHTSGLFGSSAEARFSDLINKVLVDQAQTTASSMEITSIDNETKPVLPSTPDDLFGYIDGLDNITDAQKMTLKGFLGHFLQDQESFAGNLDIIALLQDPDLLGSLAKQIHATDIETLQLDLHYKLEEKLAQRKTEVTTSTQNTKLSQIQNDIAQAKQAKAFHEYMEFLLQGIPQDSRPDVINIPPQLISQFSDGLESSELAFNPALSAGNTQKTQGLIATDLTPEKLGAFIQQIKAQIDNGTPVVVGFVKIVPNADIAGGDGSDTLYLPQVILQPKNNTAQAMQVSQSQTMLPSAVDGIAAQLNKLVAGAGSETQTATNGSYTGNDVVFEAELDEHFQNNQSGFQNSRNSSAQGALAKGTGQNNQLTTNTNPAFVALTGDSTNMTSTTQSTSFDFAGFEDAAEIFHQAFTNNPGLTSLTSSITSLVTQAPHAGQTHPATQMVAATLNKSAKTGEVKNITLRLDPPDLGRVNIRLEFEEGTKKVKAFLMVEKPETFAMLQRDAGALERALQDSGLDASGSDLNFELSQDGSLFDHNDKRDGNGTRHGAGQDDDTILEGEEIIIKSEIDWQFDPQTGLTRYSILV